MNTFEDIVRHKMIEKKLSVSEAAFRSGMSQPNFSKKLGKNNFSESDMHKIAEGLGCKLVITLEEQ